MPQIPGASPLEGGQQWIRSMELANIISQDSQRRGELLTTILEFSLAALTMTFRPAWEHDALIFGQESLLRRRKNLRFLRLESLRLMEGKMFDLGGSTRHFTHDIHPEPYYAHWLGAHRHRCGVAADFMVCCCSCQALPCFRADFDGRTQVFRARRSNSAKPRYSCRCRYRRHSRPCS